MVSGTSPWRIQTAASLAPATSPEQFTIRDVTCGLGSVLASVMLPEKIVINACRNIGDYLRSKMAARLAIAIPAAPTIMIAT